MVSISTSTINVPAIIAAVATPQSGAMDIFIGTVRNNSGARKISRLEYSAYVPMAEKLMTAIELDLRSKWSVHEVIMVHRVGMLEVGDVAVVTAVSSAHRKEAFEACRFAIDQIKSIVPIWKKEFADDGEMWVEGEHLEGIQEMKSGPFSA
jgi:molybdopterin synthase catalytic subunit